MVEGVHSQVVRVPNQDLGVSVHGMGVFFQGVEVPKYICSNHTIFYKY